MSTGFFQQLPLFRLPGGAPDRLASRPRKNSAKPPRQRHLHLGNQIVTYTLRQGQGRRRLLMTIDERGLTVGAPARITLAEIEGFISAHAVWVLAKLAEHTERHEHRHLVVRDGSRIPLLGKDIAVRIAITNGRMRAHWHDAHVLLEVRAETGCDEHAAMLCRVLQRRALSLFAERSAHYARQMGRLPPPLALSNARTRWGSCSLRGGIRINWRLIHLPLELIDYVIVHELAHLVEMNHGARFWTLVGSLYPDWRAARDELKQRGGKLPIL